MTSVVSKCLVRGKKITYGFVHCCLEDLVLKFFGEEKWQEILACCNLLEDEGASFLIHRIYKDEETLALVAASCSVLGLDLNSCLEAFGQHFLHYCQGSGYDRLLRVLGGRLEDFLTNLDSLHDHLASIYPGMNAPSFRCTHGEKGALLLHYYSDRKGLQSIVTGLVKTVSLEFFNAVVTVEEAVNEDSGHIVFKITDQTVSDEAVAESKLLTNTKESENPRDLYMNVKTFCQAFPFHVIFGSDLYVTQVGQSLQRVLGHVWRDKRVKYLEIFRIIRPHIEDNYQSILNHHNATFVVNTLPGLLNSNRPAVVLKLKGQMVTVPESDCLLFLASPRVSDLQEMQEQGIFLSDFPVHDFTRDLVLMKNARRGERELMQRLEETTNQLKIADMQLKVDKKRTDDLLHSILPAKVAARLRLNLPVPAESFETVTFLFSDIVGFTAMCSSDLVKPMDIVRVLNKMYTLFDVLSTRNAVYKVETIGDAYMVVAGVPEFVETHADQVVFMGLGMVAAIQQVFSPVDGQSLKMRVGIHTGTALAGVVGQQMPRYCLFGNAVTLANKMESNSAPGKVNISEEAISHLTKDGYVFEENPVENFVLRGSFVTRPGEDFDVHLEEDIMEITEEIGPPAITDNENSNVDDPRAEGDGREQHTESDPKHIFSTTESTISEDIDLLKNKNSSDHETFSNSKPTIIERAKTAGEVPVAVIHPAKLTDASPNLQCPFASYQEATSSGNDATNPETHWDSKKLFHLLGLARRLHEDSLNPSVATGPRTNAVPLAKKSNFLCKSTSGEDSSKK